MGISLDSNDLKPAVKGNGRRTEWSVSKSRVFFPVEHVLRINPEKKTLIYCMITMLGTLMQSQPSMTSLPG